MYFKFQSVIKYIYSTKSHKMASMDMSLFDYMTTLKYSSIIPISPVKPSIYVKFKINYPAINIQISNPNVHQS